MSEPWRGLHNPERHFHSPGYGDRCGKCSGGYCHPETPCRCCLAAEVQLLRAQVQAVREACDEHNARTVWGGDGQTWSVVDRDAILRILDGGDA